MPELKKSAAARGVCRPFTIADAMILVGASAPPLAFMKVWDPDFFAQFSKIKNQNLWNKIKHFEWVAVSLVISWTVGWLIMRYRPPRPSRQVMGRQPGMAACLAATVSMVTAMSWSILVCILSGQSIFYWALPLSVTFYTGYAVLATWTVLGYGDLLQREPGWVDSLGTVLGSFWILRMLTYVVGRIFLDH